MISLIQKMTLNCTVNVLLEVSEQGSCTKHLPHGRVRTLEEGLKMDVGLCLGWWGPAIECSRGFFPAFTFHLAIRQLILRLFYCKWLGKYANLTNSRLVQRSVWVSVACESKRGTCCSWVRVLLLSFFIMDINGSEYTMVDSIYSIGYSQRTD